MKELLMRALDTARLRGATYADVRYVDTRVETMTVKNNRVEAVTSDSTRGFGVRVIANGGWGFASSSRIGASEMDTVASTAVRIAQASSSVLREPVNIRDPIKVVGTYRTPSEQGPLDASPAETGGLLTRAPGELAPACSQRAPRPAVWPLIGTRQPKLSSAWPSEARSFFTSSSNAASAFCPAKPAGPGSTRRC